jgi:hypothetical protein
VLLTKYYPSGQIEIEIGRACGMHSGRDRCVQSFVGRPEGENHLKSIELDRRIILKWIFKKYDWTWTGLIWLRIGTGGWHL